MTRGWPGWAVLALVACGGGRAAERGAEGAAQPASVTEDPAAEADSDVDVTDPRERAEAGGWTGGSPEPPPRFCNDEGGTEWCDGEHDDDCDGHVDEGCADCVRETCVRYRISEEDVRRGSGRRGGAVCIGPVYCGRIDGFATTSPPGGCGHHHCGTIVWSDGTALPSHCTIHGRCAGGEFTARGFSW